MELRTTVRLIWNAQHAHTEERCLGTLTCFASAPHTRRVASDDENMHFITRLLRVQSFCVLLVFLFTLLIATKQFLSPGAQLFRVLSVAEGLSAQPSK